MWQDNVETIRKLYEGTNTRDFSHLPIAVEEDCEIRLPPEFPGTQEARGPQGFLSVLGELEEAFQDIRYEPQEILGEGDLVLAAVRTAGHARHTGIPVEASVYWVYTFSAGQITRMEVHLDRPRALEAFRGPQEDTSASRSPDSGD